MVFGRWGGQLRGLGGCGARCGASEASTDEAAERCGGFFELLGVDSGTVRRILAIRETVSATVRSFFALSAANARQAGSFFDLPGAVAVTVGSPL